MKRTRLKRKTPLFRRTWIARLSEKRRLEMQAYLAARDAFLALHRHCEIRQSKGCKGSAARSREVHHRAGRHGALLLDESLWLGVCRACHRFIHANPNEARKKGWLL